MLIFEQTDEFASWLKALKDIKAKAKISARLRVAQNGNLGDCQPVGEGVSEMRIHLGPGYRLYFTRTGDIIYLLLIGGDKSSQKRDINHAIEMARTLRKERP